MPESATEGLPGKPDLCFIKYKIVVFVDGSFWHGYEWEKRKTHIKSNREFWISKIERNMQRDREIKNFYCSHGWTILRFWDFEVKKELGICVKSVLNCYQSARCDQQFRYQEKNSLCQLFDMNNCHISY